MPIFEYNCEDCSYKFNQLLISRDTQVKCPLCQGDVKKLMSTFSVRVSHNATSNLPEMAGPKMCTNC
ncbi:MAG: zinc ribbon domain-containing protein [Deltaproteobacteria bacterium]|jgi:putative FmdB family regulatory protein|nr:zinc ribbon domain-containing protein [Deltaproteobacteria bacterium]MBW2238945.1 zinc ribbon domain-containing protein [Deltaproteobacteria bacterium]MBW2571969.1 zinc ribbon domain-containing protein [Deltaproteobacteria bacterium]MBW2668537.1 zinc ribbon domain-containing protein [Deltaproteobacteria bacterium]